MTGVLLAVESVAAKNAVDIQDFKHNYRPHEYLPEAAWWGSVDLSVMILALAVGWWLSRRKRAWPLSLLMFAALAYFGLWRGGCICPVGATANATIGLLHPEWIGRETVLIFLLPMVAAFLAGRVFCSVVCPLGACQHLVMSRRPFRLTLKMDLIARFLAPLLVLLTVVAALRSACYLVCFLDPFKPLFFTGRQWSEQWLGLAAGKGWEPGMTVAGGWLVWMILAGVMVLSRWLARPFCRLICPYGVLLGLFSMLGFRRRRIDVAKCVACGRCRTVCPVQAIGDIAAGDKTISPYRCLQCNRCSEQCPRDAIR